MTKAPEARPYKVTTALTQAERDRLVRAMLISKQDEATLLLLALRNLFYAMDRFNEGYTEVSFVNEEGEVYSAPLIQTKR